MSDHNEVRAISDDFQTVSLTGFTFIADRLPNDCEVCLIVETDGHLSAACWDTGTKWTQDGEPGVFHQSRGGVLYVSDVLAWLPIEETTIDISKVCWNPEYHLISRFLDCFAVYAKDADACIIIEYSGGDEVRAIFRMDVQTGDVFEIENIINYPHNVLSGWYRDNRDQLLGDYRKGKYTVLPNWE